MEWQKNISTTSYNWENAKNYCENLTYAGYFDWRLPNPQEILTIVSNTRELNTAFNTTSATFPTDDATTTFWTSQEYLDNSDAYTLSTDGIIGHSAKTGAVRVICVHGNEMPKGVFTNTTVNDKVVVTDSTTGLMWQKDYVTNRTWQQALRYCEDSTYAGYSDWQLPNKNELASLLNYQKTTAPLSDFPDMTSFGFWSSTTYDKQYCTWISVGGGTGGQTGHTPYPGPGGGLKIICSSLNHNYAYAWYISFDYANVTYADKTSTNSVRCVRQ